MNKHTPGPWETGAGMCHTVYGPKIDGRQQVIAVCPTQDRQIDYDSHQVFNNARLIAAAPDLLQALGTVLVGLQNGSVKSKPLISFDENAESADMQSLEEIVSAAIAKATQS